MSIPHPNGAWFLDTDDGTIIHFFDLIVSEPISLQSIGANTTTGTRCPPPAVYYIQSAVPREIGSVTDITTLTYEEVVCSPTNKFRPPTQLDFDPPLPDDFAFVSGRAVKYADRISLFLEEFTPSRIGADTTLVGSNSNTCIRGFISQYDFINVETFVSDGQPVQIFITSSIIAPTFGTPTVSIDGARWTKVLDLSLSSPTDLVYEYDGATGILRFGDGVNGAIPPDGEDVVLKISIKNGGGVWKFVDIIVDPVLESNLGIVGVVEDKILYTTAKIAVADIGKFTSSVTTLNGIRQFFPGIPENTFQFNYLSGLGGNLSGSGGSVVTFNCTQDSLDNYPSFSTTLPLIPGAPPTTPIVNETATLIVQENGAEITTLIGGFNQVSFMRTVTTDTPINIFFRITTPYGGDRVARLVSIGDVAGTFDAPIVTGIYGGASVVVGMGAVSYARGSGWDGSLAIVQAVFECRLSDVKRSLAEHIDADVDNDVEDFFLSFTFEPGALQI